MSGIHFGDSVTQHGDHNIGIIKSGTATDPATAFREMLTAVAALRPQLSDTDRTEIDQALSDLGPTGAAAPGKLRTALTRIAGIATFAGQTGAPVIEAVRKVIAAFGA